ncbi:MAG TPA: DUF72 domain-containing protein, partial [Thermoplasmata archaeon]|nr:DUF72 domain-containing protein [Thermoplasmata archaeon]
ARPPAEVFRDLSAVEIPETLDTPVEVSQAARWRSAAPREFRFCMKASHMTPEGWGATRAVAEALGAAAIVFETPADFGPTEANRTAIYRFFESIETDVVKAIELRGRWATHIVERICEDLNLVHAVDPFENEPATYGLAYFRIPGTGPDGSIGRSYADDDLARLRRVCAEYDDAYVLFGNETMHSDARRFQKLVGGSDFGAAFVG